MTIDRQIQRERDMLEAGQARYKKSWDRAKAHDTLGDHPAVQKDVRHYLNDLTDAIEAWKEDCASGKAGRRHTAYGLVKDVPSPVLAYLTARYVIASLIKREAETSCAITLAKAVEDEAFFQAFESQNPGATKWIDGEIKKRKITKRHQKRNYHRRLAKQKEVLFRSWTKAEYVHVGTRLIETLATARPDLFYLANKKNGKTTVRVMRASPELEDAIFRSGNSLDIAKPLYGPMVCEPKPWGPEEQGGYHFLKRTLVKEANGIPKAAQREREDLLANAQMAEVYRAVNALNSTAFAINPKVLEVLTVIWELDNGAAGLPEREDLPVPHFPPAAKDDPWLKKGWALEARAIHEHNEESRSKRIDLATCIDVATSLVHEETLYFPHQLDFRGRMYPLPTSLNPQGPDYSRALLQFAEGKHVDDAGLRWLQIHGANMFGFDKGTLDERVQWVKDNFEEIDKCAENPLLEHWWHEADKPFQFLAFCFDFKGVLEGKPSYIRVAMDGSCNGLQHLSAMLRDPVGAKAVNLAANDAQADIYAEVAKVVTQKLRDEQQPQERHWAGTFLAIGVDRKITKRSVMVMPYGGKFKSTMSYVEESLKEKLKGENPFGDDWNKAVWYLAALVHNGTREVIKGGALVMDWLQDVARLAAKEGVHLNWATPTGFVAKQAYFNTKTQEIETKLDGKTRRFVKISEATDKIDKSRSTNGISPNFVHSMDAAAMTYTINMAAEEGISTLHFIHDDYGTHAADTEKLAALLRQSFVAIYRDDILGKFFAEAQKQVKSELPAPPKMLNFDIEEVLESTYFFA